MHIILKTPRRNIPQASIFCHTRGSSPVSPVPLSRWPPQHFQLECEPTLLSGNSAQTLCWEMIFTREASLPLPVPLGPALWPWICQWANSSDALQPSELSGPWLHLSSLEVSRRLLLLLSGPGSLALGCQPANPSLLLYCLPSFPRNHLQLPSRTLHSPLVALTCLFPEELTRSLCLQGVSAPQILSVLYYLRCCPALLTGQSGSICSGTGKLELLHVQGEPATL